RLGRFMSWIAAMSILFFKWIKQNLRIKHFYGTSENAVKTQIWIAVSIYVLAAIIKKALRLDLSLYTFLQILSVPPSKKSSFYRPSRTLTTVLQSRYPITN